MAYLTLAVVHPAYGVDVTWINTASGNWSDGANWDAAAPPGAADNALITLDGTYTVTLDGDATVVSLTLGAASGVQALAVSGGQTLTLNGASTVGPNGYFALFGTLDGSGDLTIEGHLLWSGTMAGTGTTIIAEGATWCIFGGVNLSRVLDNHGTGDGMCSGGDITFNNGTFNNYADLSDEVNAINSIVNGLGTNAFNNFGTVLKDGSGSMSIGVQFNNSGIVTVTDGDLKIASGSNDDTIDVNGGELRFFEPSPTTTPTFINSGIIHLVGGDLHQPPPPVPPPLPPTFTNTGSIIVDAGRSVNVDYGTFHQQAGELNRAGDVNVAATLEWTGGLMSGAGQTIIEPAGSLVVCGGQNLWCYGVIENQGLVDIGACVTQPGSMALYAATILNQPGGIINCDPLADFSLTDTAGVNVITNLGTINKLGSAALSISVPFTNLGTLTIEDGEFKIAGGSNSGAMNINGGNLVVFEPNPEPLATFINSGSGIINVVGGHAEMPPQMPETTASFINTGTITIAAGRSFDVNGGTFYQDAGALDRDGDFIVATRCEWDGGLMAGVGRTLIEASGSLIVGGGGQRWLYGEIENHGLFDLGLTAMNLTGSIACYNATILNQPGGIIDCDPLADFNLTSAAGVNAIINEGMINKLGAARLTTTVPLYNTDTGLVSVLGDELRVNGGGTNDGQINVVNETQTGVLTFAGGSYTHAAGSSITGDGPVQFLGGTHSIAGVFDTNRVVNIQTAALNLNAPYTFPVELNLISGTLGGTADLSVTGVFSWTGGTMTGSGKTIIEPSGSCSIIGPSFIHTLERDLELRSPNCSWTGGRIDMADATIDIIPGAVLNAAMNFNPTIQPTTCCGDTSAVNNAGTFIKSGTGSISVAGTVLFNNSGVVDVQSGIMAVRGGTNTGQMDSDAGASLIFHISFNHDPVSSLTGMGYLGFLGGTHTITCTLDTNRTIEIDTSTVNFNANYTFLGTIDVANSNTSSTTIGGTGDLSIPGTLLWRAGIMTGSGRTTIEPGGTLTIYGNAVRRLSRELDNHSATASWTGAGLTFLNGTFNNLADAILTIAPTNSISFTHGGGVNAFNNSGSFSKTGVGQLNVASGVAINNSGTFNLQQGVVSVAGPHVQTAGATILDGGSLTKTGVAFITKGGLLGGTGVITGDVENLGGTVAAGLSPGTINITGDYTQGSAGALAVELGGTTPGTEYDVLTVGGTATLAGTLDVSLIGGFVPADGDVFDILSYGARVGAFSTVNLPCGPSGGCAPPVGLSLDYEPAGVTLAAMAPMPADLDGDGDVDELDLSLFINVLLGLDADAWHVAASDMDGSGSADGLDVQEFVERFLME